jgi:hypothetical protein
MISKATLLCLTSMCRGYYRTSATHTDALTYLVFSLHTAPSFSKTNVCFIVHAIWCMTLITHVYQIIWFENV